jgi:hypothetical protein
MRVLWLEASNERLLIHFSSMSDGDNGNNKFAVVDLIDDAVIADADAPGVATF